VNKLRAFTRFCVKYDAPFAWVSCALVAAMLHGWAHLIIVVAIFNACMSLDRRLTGKQP
jgi:hypothetical protein